MCKWTQRGKYHGELPSEVQAISRGQGRSLTRLVNYISGERLSDCYNRRIYYNRRDDVLECRIFQPQHAPSEFYELQSLCNAIETAERRCDARTAREFKASLPNELPFAELQNIVTTYITDNFTTYSLCAISAIHEAEIHRTLPRTIRTCTSLFQHALSSPAAQQKEGSRTRQAPVYPALARAMGQRTKRSLFALRPRYPGQSRELGGAGYQSRAHHSPQPYRLAKRTARRTHTRWRSKTCHRTRK